MRLDVRGRGDNEDRVRIKRGGQGAGHAEAVVVQAPPAAPVGVVAPSASAAPTIPARKLITIPSPFVGTFYRASAPERDAFVELGSKVRKGQTLCIVEAMKLMNEIESEAAGAVAEILVENGHAVEYGQALFRIDPA